MQLCNTSLPLPCTPSTTTTMPKSKTQVDIAAQYLEENHWVLRPAEKIEGVFKPVGKYDARSPHWEGWKPLTNDVLKKWASFYSLAAQQGKTIKPMEES